MKVVKEIQRNDYCIEPFSIHAKISYTSSVLNINIFYFRYKGTLNNKYSAFNFYSFR